ncbi:hypothetical protein WG622_00420 [Cognatishimia sp. D5M38]|uniref:Excalibur calcium-binding domain-containing protein n=1 Tax=Cognatishimia coralii TaxID=3083254 RepID=A0ABU8QBA7_9RHOB
MRVILGFGVALALTACDVPVPDSGVGFDNGNFKPRISDEPLGATATSLPPAESVSSETLDVLAATAPVPSQPTGGESAFVEASPSNPAPVRVENSGISDENDFAAVDARRSIEDDAQRRQQIAAQYQQVEATDLPERDGGAGPNIVEYAVLSKNPVGNRIYRRIGLNAANRFARNCRAYPSSDQAQIDFLSRGGPERDPRGLDPDGDGYACAWDPTPFQKLGG